MRRHRTVTQERALDLIVVAGLEPAPIHTAPGGGVCSGDTVLWIRWRSPRVSATRDSQVISFESGLLGDSGAQNREARAPETPAALRLASPKLRTRRKRRVRPVVGLGQTNQPRTDRVSSDQPTAFTEFATSSTTKVAIISTRSQQARRSGSVASRSGPLEARIYVWLRSGLRCRSKPCVTCWPMLRLSSMQPGAGA
jgi:hypothetical protein